MKSDQSTPTRASGSRGGAHILVIHGPNLNLLGQREPDIYGSETLDDINLRLSTSAQAAGVQLSSFQSNVEGSLVDRVQQSLRRGRTIELHREQYSEEGTFKSLMAAGSCLLLMAGLVVLLVFCTVEGVRMAVTDAASLPPEVGSAAEAGPPRWPLWLRLWPVYPFALLLLLQLFRLVFAGSRSATTGQPHGQQETNADNGT